MNLSFDCYRERIDSSNGKTYLDVYMSLLLPDNKRAGLKFSIASTANIATLSGDEIYHDVTFALKDNAG
jgi:hypothetical protein